jgi:hypothetical protein
MAEMVVSCLIGALLMLSCLGLCRRHSKSPTRSRELKINDLLPIHYREFEAVEQRLLEYEALLQRIHSEHREAALTYMEGLKDDFARVERLINHAMKFLPEISVAEEAVRFLVGVKFRFGYQLARLEVELGISPARQLKALTRKVRMLVDLADRVLAQTAREHGLPVLESDLNR